MEDTNIDELTPEERRIHEKYMDKAIAQAKRLMQMAMFR